MKNKIFSKNWWTNKLWWSRRFFDG